MSNEEINRTIGEALGWTRIDERNDYPGLSGYVPIHGWLDVLPDYSSDLNAMHEAIGRFYRDTSKESAEEEQERVLFEMLLTGAVEHPLYATARQYAEAFLRTLRKWKKD